LKFGMKGFASKSKFGIRGRKDVWLGEIELRVRHGGQWYAGRTAEFKAFFEVIGTSLRREISGSRVSRAMVESDTKLNPRYVLALVLTNVFFASFIFSSTESPFAPKKSSQRPNTSSWEYVSGRSVRYAKPVVEKTSSRRAARVVSSPSLGEEDDRAERETMGSEEKEVDIVAGMRGRERMEVYV